MIRWQEGLGQFDQNTVACLGMQERDPPGQAGARGLVNKREVSGPRMLQGSGDIRCLKTEVVRPFPPPLQESGDTPGRVDRLKEFDLTVLHGEKHGAHALIRNRGLLGHGQAEDVPVKPQGLLQASHDNGDVGDAREHELTLADLRPRIRSGRPFAGNPTRRKRPLSMQGM
jgi:hypothetical protein